MGLRTGRNGPSGPFNMRTIGSLITRAAYVRRRISGGPAGNRFGVDLGQSTLEERSLGPVLREVHGSSVGGGRLGPAAQPAPQGAPRGACR